MRANRIVLSKIKRGFRHSITKSAFLLSGIFSLCWVLLRVLPKPSRLQYPCVQAASPFAAGFLTWLFGSLTLTFSFIKFKNLIRQSRPLLASLMVLVMLASSITLTDTKIGLYADQAELSDIQAGPVGEGKGVHPGRVIWAHDRDATNSKCTLNYGDGYFLSKNTDIDKVQRMLDSSILNLTGEAELNSAWNSMFTYFNEQKGRGSRGYESGEKIFIKTNFVNASQCNSNFGLLNKGSYKTVRTTPQVILAVVRHLVNEVGVAEENISFGDPMQRVVNSVYNVIYAEFPNVRAIDQVGGKGRLKAIAGTANTIQYSDHGDILREGDPVSWQKADHGDPVTGDAFYKCIENAAYMINIAALKAHHRAGVTLCAKNHFGSHTRSSARQLHMGLVNPNGVPDDAVARFGYGQYRIQVDLLGHELLGGNTVLNIVDGLWGGTDAGAPPKRFTKSPFSHDWSSSIFLSQDVVALESVCFDILKNEFPSDHPGMHGVDDYLLQAASSDYWPDDFEYDPENDGSVLGSLGVHEHWNNAKDRQYSRNLGEKKGIELIYLNKTALAVDQSISEAPRSFRMHGNYPNPFNPSTTIQFELVKQQAVEIQIYSSLGRLLRSWSPGVQRAGIHRIQWDGKTDSGSDVGTGVYFCRVKAGAEIQNIKMTLLR